MRTDGNGAQVRVGVDIGGTFTDAGGSWIAERSRPFREGAHHARATCRPAWSTRSAGCRSSRPSRRGVRPRHDRRHQRRSSSAAARRVALLTTAGFRDVYEIGRGEPPGDVRPPLPAAAAAGAAPRVVRARRSAWPPTAAWCSRSTARRRAPPSARSARAAYEAVAVCLLHAYANPVHELRRWRELLAEALPELRRALLARVAAGVARVRAHLDDGRQRLHRARRRRYLGAARGASCGDRGFARRPAGDAVERRRDGRRRRPAARPSRRCSRARSAAPIAGGRRRPRDARARPADLHRHGRHHRSTSAWSSTARAGRRAQTRRSRGMPLLMPSVDDPRRVGAGGGSVACVEAGAPARRPAQRRRRCPAPPATAAAAPSRP